MNVNFKVESEDKDDERGFGFVISNKQFAILFWKWMIGVEIRT